MMRVLAGAVVRQDPKVLAAYLHTLQWQETNDVQIDFAFVDDNDDLRSKAVLRSCPAKLLAAGARGSSEYGVGEYTHGWNVPAFHRLAAEKQRLLQLAVDGGYDALWLVDSDLMCGRSTLQSLLDTEAPIVSAVFWTRWTPESPPLPQVWQQHPYGFEAAGWTEEEFLGALRDRKLVRVRGLGACTVIRREALLAGASFELVEGLPSDGMWQGEDRHFCIRAEGLHIPMYADAWPEVWHCYRPSDRADLTQVLEHLARPKPSKLRLTDWVSLALEPLGDSRFAGHTEFLRGRLGLLRLHPDIVTAVRSMNAPDARFVRISDEALVRVRLLDARRGRRPRS